MVVCSGDGELDGSLQHQESEIKEEIFTPDLEQVEQVRLQEIVKTRSMLRGAVVRGRGRVGCGSSIVFAPLGAIKYREVNDALA